MTIPLECITPCTTEILIVALESNNPPNNVDIMCNPLRVLLC